MKMGKVVTIRLNPKDCMSVIDILDACGVSNEGMSYSSMVALSVAALLENARKTGLIRERSGFEYLKMMEQYLDAPRNKNKLMVTDRIQEKVLHEGAPPIMQAPAYAPLRQPEPVEPEVIEPIHIQRARRQFDELEFKRKHSKINMDAQEIVDWYKWFRIINEREPTDGEWNG